ncbi:MarR family winged helix-turn-helix transcriptional regulator [Euzebya tangerina]|uniref:MarR family winged helix-turn-helix transcriptional regulator n=1 Tax=Euzebya tangerina TaxID=591198 RepID=UPI000E315666|nr:MarR family winged helix-turn-helix transcriptional regulator [Euzebya tangerina]
MVSSIPERGPATTAEQVADLLHHTASRLRHAVRRDLKDTGVTPAQWRALRMVSCCDSPPRMSQVAEWLRIARRSATDVIDELEEQGLVARSPDPTDRRAVVVEATEAGRDLLGTLTRRRRQVAARQLEVLSEAELATLADLLARIDDT